MIQRDYMIFIHQFNRMVKIFSNVIFLFFATTFLSVVIAQQAPAITALPLGKSVTEMQNTSTYAYFSSTFNTSKKLLAVTLNPTQKISINEYLSLNDSASNQAYTQYPNTTSYSHRCNDVGLSTCIIDLSDSSGTLPIREVTLYLSVQASHNTAYSIYLELINEASLDFDKAVHLDFSKSEAAVLKLDASGINLLPSPSILFTYTKVGGQFGAIAGLEAVPHSSLAQDIVLKANPYGTYQKIMNIPSINNASYIYVLVSSQRGSTINVTFTQDTPTLSINSTISQLSSESSNYTIQLSNFTQNLTELETLYIQISAFTGYGSFYVEYCQILDWQLDNLNGTTFQIVISPQIRYACESYHSQQSNSSITPEWLSISTVNPISFGYEITLKEQYIEQPILINQQVMNYAVQNESNQNYPLRIPVESYSYYINYTQYVYQNQTGIDNQTQLLSFQLKQCQVKNKAKTCIIISNASGAQGQLNFTSRQGYTYEILALSPTETHQIIYYELFLGYNQVNNTNLIQNKKYLQEVALREYKFYHINLTSLKARSGINFDLAQINITAKTLNGNIDVLSSISIADPTIDSYIKNSSQIKFQSAESIKYTIDSSIDIIYLSVYGQTASLFDLEFSFDPDIDTPDRYTRIEDDIINIYALNSSKPYQLLSFEAHIKPYTVTVDGSPKCIRYGYSLPLSETCFKRLPSLLYEKILYLNISNGKSSSTNFNFNVTASSGQNNLTAQNSILVSCNEACYSIVDVYIQEDSRVIIKGKGQIQSLLNQSQTNVKDTLTLTCARYPCSSQINASLPYGGAMNIYLMESEIAYLDGTTIPFQMMEIPKSALFPIKSTTDFNDIIVRSDGMNLVLTYSLVYLDNNNQNVLNVNFTELLENTDYYFSSIQLRSPLLFLTSEMNPLKLDCSSASIYCLIAVTFLPNYDVPFSIRFVKNEQAFISSYSGLAIKTPINQPVLFNSSLQMSRFEINNNSNDDSVYRLDVEAMSDCRPVVIHNTNISQIEHEYLYGPVFINGTDYPITFQIVTQQPCLYYASLTNSIYQSIISDRYYTLQTKQGEAIAVLTMRDSQLLDFTLRVETEDQGKIDYILVNQLNNSYDQIVVPTISSSYLSAQSNVLQVNTQKYHKVYVLKIISNSSSLRVIAEQTGNIIMAHNQAVRRTVLPGSPQKLIFYSKKSILLNVQNFTGTVSVIMIEKDNSLQMIINNDSVSGSRLFQINQDSNQSYIVTYEVILNNPAMNAQSISISFTEDNKYLRPLYERIIFYDAFTQTEKKNCYNYKAPMQLGRDKVLLDFVLDNHKYPDCSCIDLLYNVSVKGMAADRALKVLNTNFTKLKSSVNAYRLEAKYFADQEYTFCFSTPNQSAINKEYYILINNPILKHIIPDEEIIKYLPLELDSYEIVQQFINQNLMAQLTICDPQDSNDKILVGSPSQLPQTYSELEEYHKNSDSVFAKFSTQLGYYFLGVASDQALQGAYSLKYSKIGKDSQLLASSWELESTDIANITMDHNGHIVLTLPKLGNLGTINGQKNITLTYTAYILDMTEANTTNSSNNSSFAILSRCPNYVFDKTALPFVKQEVHSLMFNKSINFTYADLKEFQNSNDQITLKFKKGEIPNKFNITGRANIKVNSQAFSYFYNTKYMELPTSSSKGHESEGQYVAAAVIIILLILVAGGIYGYLRYKKKINQQKVDFELANFGENSAVVEKNQGLITAPKTESTKGYYEMNEQIK